MYVFDEILSELRSGDAYDAKLAEKASAELAELQEYKRLYNEVASLLNSANYKLSEISRLAHREPANQPINEARRIESSPRHRTGRGVQSEVLERKNEMPENLSKNAMLWSAMIEALNNFWMDNSVPPEVTTARLVELSGECSRLAHHMIVKSSGLTRATELRTGADGAVAEESPNNLRTEDSDAGAMGDAG